MSAGIQEFDRVASVGSAWWVNQNNAHQHQKFEDRVPVSVAEEILNYPLEKVQSYRYNAARKIVPIEGGFHLIRPDHDIVLLSNCGNRTTVFNNLTMLRRIDDFILAEYKDLFIESVGTLWNGQTAFVNLRTDTYQVRGDKSPTQTNLCYSNPLGASYRAFAHSTRIVCQNTLWLAESQGFVNKTLAKFSHTKGALAKIQDHIIDLSDVFLGLTKHRESMEALVSRPITDTDIHNFLDKVFPVKDREGKTKEGRGFTVNSNNRKTFSEIFESQRETMETETAYSAYGILQAYADQVDHRGIIRGETDDAAVAWDSVAGNRAKKKAEAFDYLMTTV